MGRPPAYLFVVRHGYRLDAADKQWHLSSPTPYDPPLTYSGWQQAKSLGVRIGAIIRERVQEEEREAAERQKLDPSQRRKRKRYKVVFHSSPFLRCIQTATAISAGLAQDSTPFGPAADDASSPSPPAVQSPHTRPTVNTTTDVTTTPRSRKPVPIRRSVLRLDAFLGEWLSPGYFELITPPPESVMMLASAKADLLRREDYTSYPNFSAHFHSNSQGQLWSPTGRSSPPVSSPDSLDNMGALATSLPQTSTTPSPVSQPRRVSSPLPTDTPGYVSPVPHYAVNSNNTIPPGYVTHARDACVDIDYQWDSIRPPLDWGDGGTFPEEWTSMHRRFRNGIQHLVDWYTTAENPTEMVTKTVFRNRKDSDSCAVEDGADVETEAVVILVSHGAGCNALIGAITHQPVLMDVGMASLTMAVRKPDEGQFADGRASRSGPDRPDSSSSERANHTVPVHQYYDLKIFASTDHLRSPTLTPATSRSPSIANIMGGTRGRHANSFSSALSNFSFNDSSGSRTSSANAALSSLRRGSNNSSTYSRPIFGSSNSAGGGITVGSGVTSFLTIKPPTYSLRKPSVGLWSPISADMHDDDDDDDNMVLNFSHETSSSPNMAATVSSPLGITSNGKAVPSEGEFLPSAAVTNGNHGSPGGEHVSSPIRISKSSSPRVSSPELGGGLGGLWGGGTRPPDEADNRDLSSTKRRWTTNERA
ncbi:hypothetical protein B0H63DRAFT_409977 [Podospora didyma]|uniref:Phosphoglycerate mutase n=1 Tax=Podospora didyma TaxID=330526 RepID=A0AAE0U432_9PEZI|nr:hypothetical protein B0H63DRAFT_409977 [Podospora didyma]